jgi:hypothetical protein
MNGCGCGGQIVKEEDGEGWTTLFLTFANPSTHGRKKTLNFSKIYSSFTHIYIYIYIYIIKKIIFSLIPSSFLLPFLHLLLPFLHLFFS